MDSRLLSIRNIMNVLPMELWMQVFREMPPAWQRDSDWLKQMTTCRLFHSLLEVKLYEDVRIYRGVNEEHEFFPKVPQSTLFVQTLTARPNLFSLVRKLQLYPSDESELLDDEIEPDHNYWNHPVLWQLPYFSHLRSLHLASIHIDIDCYTAIRSIPRLEELEVEGCDIDAAVLDLQPFQGNTISILSISHPKDGGDGWAALMTPGIHTFTMVNSYEDLNMDEVLGGLLSCDLRRTLTKLEWTLEDFDEELCQFIEPCVQLESLSITHRSYPQEDDAEARSSHFEELSSGSLPMLSKFGGSAEHAAAIVAGRPVHSVSLQLWDDTPKDVLLALQLSKVPVTKLKLSEGDHTDSPNELPIKTGMFLENVPATIEILTLRESFDKEKLQSWIPALSNLSQLQTIKCHMWSENFTQIEVVRSLSEACPSIRKIFLIAFGSNGCGTRWTSVWRNDGSWEHYPET